MAYQNFTFNIWQPRLSGTYTVNADTVIRASAGRFTEGPNAAYEIYNTLENDLPFALLGPDLSPYGRTAPGLAINPPTSINYDLSLEQRIHGTDWSFKLTPFLRQTQDQVQNFYLNQATGFVSGTNVGSQRSQGVEFQIQKGDFARDGISGLLSFAYTNSYIKYGTLPNSPGTILSPINNTIAQYNAYTKACLPGGAYYGKSQFGQPLCGATSSGAPAARCYAGGEADPSCATLIIGGTAYQPVANPYWNLGGQSLIDPGQNFATYDIFPGGIGSSTQAYGSPYVATMVLKLEEGSLYVDAFVPVPGRQQVRRARNHRRNRSRVAGVYAAHARIDSLQRQHLLRFRRRLCQPRGGSGDSGPYTASMTTSARSRSPTSS